MIARNVFSAAVLVAALGMAGGAQASDPVYNGSSQSFRMSLTFTTGNIHGDLVGPGGLFYQLKAKQSGQTVRITGTSQGGKAKGFAVDATVVGTIGITGSQIQVANVPVPTPINFTLDCANGKAAKAGAGAAVYKLSGSTTVAGGHSSISYTAQATLTSEGSSFYIDGSVAIQKSPLNATVHLGGLVNENGTSRALTVSIRAEGAAVGTAQPKGTATYDKNTNQLTVQLTGLVPYGYKDAALVLK